MLVSCPGQQFNDLRAERYQSFDYFTAWQGACLCPVQHNNSMISGQNDTSLSITLLRGKELFMSCPGQQFNDLRAERYQSFDYFTAWQGACLCPIQGNNSVISGQNDTSLSITLLRGKEHPCVLPRATIQ
ncbi:hypothetical protein TNCV_1664301 [Trichonephila clavipes]|uniref:Uncharacterized protein n=1 Tax=Trichonephila clavipes TaxID=2585209 RepID=A0A8X6RUD4_TRICX|nr:hypothetical protein TNCV_1664301 [Trichonephila clavipes]